MDVFGDQVVCFNKNLIQRRHMALQDVLVDLVREAGLSVEKEVGPGDGSRPGDLYIPRWTADTVTVVDCTVRHSVAPSRGLMDPATLPHWRRQQEEDKTEKYLERCREVGWDFVPFLVDLWGGLGPGARRFVAQYVALLTSPLPEEERRGAEAQVWQRIMVAVQRHIGKQLTLFDSLAGPPDASLLERAP